MMNPKIYAANIKPKNFSDAESLMNPLGLREMAYVAGWNLVYTDDGGGNNDSTTTTTTDLNKST